MSMKFRKAVNGRAYNKDQKEGIAKILDGIAQAFIIGTALDGSVSLSTKSTPSLQDSSR
jgi:hypothetical protein